MADDRYMTTMIDEQINGCAILLHFYLCLILLFMHNYLCHIVYIIIFICLYLSAQISIS